MDSMGHGKRIANAVSLKSTFVSPYKELLF
jgi:hypothetical protein